MLSQTRSLCHFWKSKDEDNKKTGCLSKAAQLRMTSTASLCTSTWSNSKWKVMVWCQLKESPRKSNNVLEEECQDVWEVICQAARLFAHWPVSPLCHFANVPLYRFATDQFCHWLTCACPHFFLSSSIWWSFLMNLEAIGCSTGKVDSMCPRHVFAQWPCFYDDW